MTDFRERFKRVGFGREDVDVNRVLRSQQLEESRHDKRSEHYSLRRDLRHYDDDDADDDEDCHVDTKLKAKYEDDGGTTMEKEAMDNHDCSPGDSRENHMAPALDLAVAVQQRLLELEKWKEKRDKKKFLEKKKLKPAFKVGVVHHKVYSPPLIKDSAPQPHSKLCKSKKAQQEQQPPKRVTRATEKRLAAKAVTNQQKREVLRKKKKILVNNKNEPKTPIAPKNYQFKAPIGVAPLPMFGRSIVDDDNTNENLNFDNLYTEPSSTSGIINNISDISDSVFSSKIDSFNTSKSSNRRSNLNKSNINSCDSKEKLKVIDKSLNNSFENSSVDRTSQKLTSNDQEMQSDHEEIKFGKMSLPVCTKLPSKKKRSLKKSKSQPLDTEPMVIDESKTVSQNRDEMMEVQESNDNDKDDVAKNETINRRVLRGRRSEKVISNKTASPLKKGTVSYTEKPVVESPTSKSQIMNNLSIIDSKLKKTTLDSPALALDSANSSTKRRSMRNFKANFDEHKMNDDSKALLNPDTIESSSEVMNSKEPTPKSRNNRKSNKSNVSKEEITLNSVEQENNKTEKIDGFNNILNSIILKNTRKSAAHKRKSAKITNDENTPADTPVIEISEPLSEDSTIGCESVFDLQNKHLLDITLSDLNKFKSTRRKKSVKVSNQNRVELQDQSLIKFSPRQSLRLQIDKKKPQGSTTEVTTMIENPGHKRVDESLIKFDPLITKSNENLNESTSSEPTRRSSPNHRNDLRLNKTLPDELPFEKPPVFYSPFIVTSRGKSNIRKEIQKRRFSQRVEDDIPTKDTVMQSLNISVEGEERTAQYYKYLLDKEIERLNKRCDSWNLVKEAETTPEDVRYLILAAVGQTQLLINKKFQRFRGLVLDCETGKGEMLVTCKDLQGFWEMMYMEINNVDNRFNKLQELKEKDWVDEDIEEKEMQKPKKKLAPAKKLVAKKKLVTKASSIRAHIMAARKKMENKESEIDVEMEAEVKEPGTLKQQKEEAKLEESKSQNTPKIARRLSNPKIKSLTKKSPASSRRRSALGASPLIMMKLSQICKTPEVQLDGSIVYINSDQTPAKSILKSKPKIDTIGSVAKSKNKVLFKAHHTEVQEFDNYRDSIELNGADVKPVERKLDFEDESDNDSELPVGVEEKKEENKIELNHQLFLDEDRVISERFVPILPKTPSLDRSNSERVTKSPKSYEVERPDAKVTFRTRRLVTKRKTADAESSESGEDTPKPAKSPKITRRTPKISKTLNSTDISDAVESTTPRLRRAKSLSAVDRRKDESETVIKTPRSSVKRASSRTKVDLQEKLENTLTTRQTKRSLKMT